MTLIQVVEPGHKKFILTSEDVFYAAMIPVIVASILHFIFEMELSGILAWCILLPCLIMMVTPIWGWNEYYPDQYDSHGPVTLSFTDVKTISESYPLSEMQGLTFDVNDYKGERKRYPRACGPCLLQGINNYIRFSHKNTAIEIQFLLRSENELNALGAFLTEMYKTGIDFNETIGGTKSYGLNTPRNYAETQVWKKIWSRRFLKKK